MTGRILRGSTLPLHGIVLACQLAGMLLVRFVFFGHAGRDALRAIVLGCGGACVLGSGILCVAELLRRRHARVPRWSAWSGIGLLLASLVMLAAFLMTLPSPAD
jgi:hypothetical protein